MALFHESIRHAFLQAPMHIGRVTTRPSNFESKHRKLFVLFVRMSCMSTKNWVLAGIMRALYLYTCRHAHVHTYGHIQCIYMIIHACNCVILCVIVQFISTILSILPQAHFFTYSSSCPRICAIHIHRILCSPFCLYTLHSTVIQTYTVSCVCVPASVRRIDSAFGTRIDCAVCNGCHDGLDVRLKRCQVVLQILRHKVSQSIAKIFQGSSWM